VPGPGPRYRPTGVPDYSHRFHAGNVGDVWKHCALVAILERLSVPPAGRVVYLDSHAGEGRYALGPTGEWTEGIGRLWGERGDGDTVARYVALCRRLGTGEDRPTSYPGSPTLARALLGPAAEVVLWEREEAAFARLAAQVEGDARTRLHRGDGLTALAEEVRGAEARAGAVVVLVDPPWVRKVDWLEVPGILAAAARASTRATFILWYPVKSLTRPNAMIACLRTAGVPGTIGELVTTPLEHQRQRLNGSGVLLVRPPAGAVETLAAAAPVIGARCATHAGAWSFRLQAWS
jgi:23S rRNA (adenine2030-N6)-methyltransferase